MNQGEKYLYHQIHPLKLAVDWIAAFISLYFFWVHELVFGLVILFVPSIIASFLMIRFVNVEKQKRSPFGVYVARYMTKLAQGIRFLGMLIMVLGAWHHLPLVIGGGLLVIVLAWCWGLLKPA